MKERAKELYSEALRASALCLGWKPDQHPENMQDAISRAKSGLNNVSASVYAQFAKAFDKLIHEIGDA